jgi:hypothetical protein
VLARGALALFLFAPQNRHAHAAPRQRPARSSLFTTERSQVPDVFDMRQRDAGSAGDDAREFGVAVVRLERAPKLS